MMAPKSQDKQSTEMYYFNHLESGLGMGGGGGAQSEIGDGELMLDDILQNGPGCQNKFPGVHYLILKIIRTCGFSLTKTLKYELPEVMNAETR